MYPNFQVTFFRHRIFAKVTEVLTDFDKPQPGVSSLITVNNRDFKMNTFEIIQNAEKLLLQPYRENKSHFEAIFSIIQRDISSLRTSDPDWERLKEALEKLQAHKDAPDNPSFLGSCAREH